MDINFYEKVVKLGFLCGDKFLYGIGGLHGYKRKRGALHRLVRKTGGSLADDGLKVCR